VSSALQFYISTLLIYAGVDILAAWGLNLQFGVAGLLSFAFIVFQAVGAYTAAVLALGPDTQSGGFQHYVGGFGLPFPIPILAAGAAGGLLSVPIGLVTLRRLRSDYQAVVLLVISIIATIFVTNAVRLFNGAAGLALVPEPLSDQFGVDPLTYQWIYVVYTAVICVIGFFVVQRISHSPLGRAMRAMRDNELAASVLGKNVIQLRLLAFAIGGVMAGISGGILVQFIGTWAPGAWTYAETFVFFAAIIIGGRGNNLGVVVGVLLVPVGFLEATRFLPSIGRVGLTDALSWIVIGLLLLGFLWFRPQGVVPEHKQVFPTRSKRIATSIQPPVDSA